MKIQGIQLLAELKNCAGELIDDQEFLIRLLKEGMKISGLQEVKTFSNKFQPIGVTVVAIIQESHISVHTFPEAEHVSVDIFHCSDDARPLYTLLTYIKEKLSAESLKVMEIARGDSLGINYTNAIISPGGDVNIKYFYSHHLFRKKTPFQQIDIVNHRLFGKMLFLNNDLQIAEKDFHLYNEAMLAPFQGSPPLENILVIGGGDGGVLNDLMKLAPRKVTLVEIDEEVITYSRRYLPEINGQAFEAPEVTLVIADAMDFLEEKEEYDGIVFDLTMDAEKIQHMDKEMFFRRFFTLISRSMVPGGILSLHCGSALDRGSFLLIEKSLLSCFSSWEHRAVFIPSFCESRIFASTRKSIPSSFPGK